MAAKKKPTHLKILKGTYRPWRENPDEPIFTPAIPEKPKFLSAEASEEWDRITKHFLDQGILTHIDMAALAMYCQAYGRWQALEKKLPNDKLCGLQNGSFIMNPVYKIARYAYQDLKWMLSEFGMTPSSRTQIKANKKTKKEENPFAKFDVKK